MRYKHDIDFDISESSILNEITTVVGMEGMVSGARIRYT